MYDSLESIAQKNTKFILKASKRKQNTKELLSSNVVNISIEELAIALYKNEHLPEVSFNVEVLKAKDNVLFIAGLHTNNKLIVFDGTEDNVRVDLWACVEDKPPIIYQDILVERGYNYDKEHSNYLILRPKTTPTILNKRNAFRVRVDIKCDIQLGKHKGIVVGNLKDVSTEGFAVEIKKELTQTIAIPNSDNISIVFSDIAISNNLIRVSGLCVRRVDNEDTFLYGVHAPNADKDYKSFVVSKQTSKCHK